MKIIQVIPELGIAGAERMAESLTLSLYEMGDDVEVISLYNYKSDITDNLEKHGIRVHYLDKKKGMDLSMFPKLYKAFKQIKPDVVHTHRHVLQYTAPIAYLLGISCNVHTIHNIANKERSIKKLQKFLFKRNKVIPIAISDKIKKSICDFYNVQKECVPLIYNGIDIKKCVKKEKYSIDDSFRIIHVGRFNEQKNHMGILDAFKIFLDRYSNAELFFYGEGDMFEAAKEYAKKLCIDKNVHFMGVSNEISKVLHMYDLFILPSFYEGMPISVIEAMAAGMPIVATNVGGIPDMIDDGETGIMCEICSDDIAKAIERAYSDGKLREKIGKNASVAVRKFDVREMASKYRKVYAGKC